MASEIYNGKLLRLKFNNKKFLHATSCKLDFNTKLEEIATKDTNGTISIPSNYTWTGSTESLLANKATGDTTHVTFDEILALQLAGTPIDIDFTTDVTGDFIYSGKVLIEGASITATVGESAKVSISFKGNGDLERDTVV
ncbi:hypothetical protein CFS9_03000 [Flavobacterium sp. CFS9]|uniref:Phage tail tube protein n=1 Tax=Flavobacterium sp. CFS9 TaxID=3143118 RepID=A0AAT9GWR8_9FLAO